jgi:glyoxylase I family protein
MFQGIEHLAIAARDPQHLAGFYVETLGFTEVLQQDGSYLLAAANGTILEIIPAHPATRTDHPEPKQAGLRHIAISVVDFDGALQHLRNRQVLLEGEPYWNGANRIVFFRDPEGNILHLIFRPHPLLSTSASQ